MKSKAEQMKQAKCPVCRGVGYVRPPASEGPPVPEGAKKLTPPEAQEFANWLIWGKPCPRCEGTGHAIEET